MTDQGRVELAVERAFQPVSEAIERRAIPGAVLGIVTTDGAVAIRHGGVAAHLPTRRPMTEDTWFDLASLTKVLLTTLETLRLVEAGRVDLDDPVSRHLPDFSQVTQRTDLRGLTLRALLTHTAGLPAWEPLYTWSDDPARLRARVLQEPWPLGAPCYSDIGFVLLGLVLERVHGAPVAEAEATRSDGLATAPPPDRTAATEACPWRNRILCAEVHDENAAALGGLAGHAGLFGTITGVLEGAHGILSRRLLSPAAIAAMVEPQSATRTLGWQRRHAVPEGAEPPWTGGHLCSPSTIGHTGFTGTGLWIDMERGHGWALLTNRVHPTRHADTGIQDLRRTVGNIVAAALTC